MRREPSIEPGERATRRVLRRYQLRSLARGQRGAVIDIEIGAPMMAARARQGRPAEDGLDPFGRRQRQGVERLSLPVEQRPLAAVLAVPDKALTVEVAERGRRFKHDTVLQCRRPHREEGLHHCGMQQAVRILEDDEVAARAPGELVRKERSEAAGRGGCRGVGGHAAEHTGTVAADGPPP